MDNYLNKKVEITEKVYGGVSSTKYGVGLGVGPEIKINKTVGVITGFWDDKFIELDNKILLNLNFIYKIELVD